MILDYEEIFNKIKEDFKLFNLEDIFNTIDQVSKDKNLSKLDVR